MRKEPNQEVRETFDRAKGQPRNTYRHDHHHAEHRVHHLRTAIQNDQSRETRCVRAGERSKMRDKAYL